MKKSKSILLLFCSYFLSFSNAGEKKFIGVKFHIPNKSYHYFFCEKNISPLYSLKIPEKKPTLISKSEIEKIFKNHNGFLQKKNNDLYAFYDEWKSDNGKICTYNKKEKRMHKQDFVKFFKKDNKDKGKDKDNGKWTNRRIVLFPIIAAIGLVGSIGAYLFFSKDDEKDDKKFLSSNIEI